LAGYNEKPRKLHHPYALDWDDETLVTVTPEEAAQHSDERRIYLNPKNGEQLVLVRATHERVHFKRKIGQLPDFFYKERYLLWQAGHGGDE